MSVFRILKMRTFLLAVEIASLAFGVLAEIQDAGPNGGNRGLTVGSFNIRNMKNDAGTVNDWNDRKSDLVDFLRHLDLDVFGMQEVYPEQLAYIRTRMPEWEFVGEFRNADRISGEASPVCYRKGKFEAMDKGTFWLSETPEVPGSKSWNTACTRVCSYLILKERSTGIKFCFANTHTDHQSAEAREKGMLLILDRMKRFGGNAPIVFVGDHNCCYESAPASAVRKRLLDARDISETKDPGPINTFHQWGALKDDPDWRIDYIYVSDGVEVADFVTHDERRPNKELYLSDHFPITATIRLPNDAGVLDKVDVFIGTEGTGHVTPAATVPFGMIQAGPDTGVGKWDYCAGYQYSDDAILGFSQTHLSGTGCPDLGDVSIMPFTGEFDGTQASRFRKTDEKAEPGWYEVTLARSGIKVEITASERVAHYAFAYTNAKARVYVNLPFAIHYPQNPGWARCKWFASESHFVDDRTLVGSYERTVWNRRKVGFAIRFDHPFKATREIPAVEGKAPSRYLLDFDLKSGEPLKVKVALSTSDSAAALRNLEAESAGWDLKAVRAAATSKWDDVLSRFAVEGEPDRVKAFYTALYRLCVQPNDIADAGYAPFYSTFSTWDTYRAAHPLYTIFLPERVQEMIDSLLRQGRITGYLPVWTLWGSENQCMIGTHSVPIIVDAYLKGLWAGDVSAAFEQINDTLTRKHEGRDKEDWDLLDRYGYYPFDVITGESASRTLECAYDDWCAAKMAERLGQADAAAFFARRAENWRNLIDPETKMVRGRDSVGQWRTPFDPFELGHGAESGNDFTEGNSWQYTWHVQQNPEGLIAALGGQERFVARLESLFAQEKDEAAIRAHHDVSGLIGQYAHGNEPSHHVIYLFQYAGRGDLTAKYVREVFDTQYGTTPDGLCGNDDCGQMSAWYIFSAMGFYPLNPCGGDYVLGAPQFPKICLSLLNGKSFTILANGLSKKNKYVKSVTFNGVPLKGFIFKHADLMSGGELVFEMTEHLDSLVR